MKTLHSIQNRIARLRTKHTALFRQNRFREMQTVQAKIIHLYNMLSLAEQTTEKP